MIKAGQLLRASCANLWSKTVWQDVATKRASIIGAGPAFLHRRAESEIRERAKSLVSEPNLEAPKVKAMPAWNRGGPLFGSCAAVLRTDAPTKALLLPLANE